MFVEDKAAGNVFKRWYRDYEDERCTPDDRVNLFVRRTTLSEIPKTLGKERNNTAREIGKDNWDYMLDMLWEQYGSEIESWINSKEANEKKAYKTIKRIWTPNWEN